MSRHRSSPSAPISLRVDAPIPRQQQNVLTRCVRQTLLMALISSVGALPLAQAADATTATVGSRIYNVPPGPLGDALASFAAAAGVSVQLDAKLVEGRRTPGLNGSHTIQAGFAKLVVGSGLEVVERDAGTFVLRQATTQSAAPGAASDDDEALLPAVKVKTSPATDGSAEQGYRSETVSAVGPWQGRSLQDTPYSITVIPKELIENLQATTPDQLYRISPTTQFTRPQYENDQPLVYMRGFLVSVPYRDGVPSDQYGHGTTTEDIESVEIFSGLSGFLYGPGNVGGMINYVSKRPTTARMNRVTLGNNGGSNYYAQGDFGGPIDTGGRTGYRINGIWQGGDTAIDNQNIKKRFVSGAFAWHVTDTLLWHFDAAYRDYEVEGGQATWGLASGVARPRAEDIDASISWGQQWVSRYYKTERYGTQLRWDANDGFTLRAAWQYSNSRRNWSSSSNTIQANGTYTQLVYGFFAPGDNSLLSEQFDQRGQVFADIGFKMGAVTHKLTTGAQYRRSWQDRFANEPPDLIYTDLSLSGPTYFDKPVQAHTDRGPLDRVMDYSYTSLLIGDDLRFDEHWSLLAGVAHSTIDVKPIVIWGTRAYKKSAVTPNVSLIFKPVEAVTTYASYIEALEQGATAAEEFNGQRVVNAGQVMEPLTSKQVEVGVKATIGGMLLTTALFQIDKALRYYDVINPLAPEFVQDGRQVHRGIEFTGFGKVTNDLTLTGGFTLLDAKVKKQKQTPALEGKQPSGVAETVAKLRSEYRLPMLPSMSFSAAISYTDRQYVDAMNADQLPAYTLFDAGARYQTQVAQYPLMLRLDVNNLTGKAFWSQDGSLGEPRTVLFSASLKF